jgi:hypothetical protein
MVGAILRGMEDCMDMVLVRNRNALTRAAYLEILDYMFEKAGTFKRRVVSICLEDIRGPCASPIGWELYLQNATSVVLKGIDAGIFGSGFADTNPSHEPTASVIS